MRHLTGAVLALAAVLLSGPAWAKDMCFQFGSKGLLVVRGYRPPSPGKCRTWAAYEASTDVPYPANATACLNASRSKLYVHWTWSGQTFFTFDFYSANTVAPYPSLTGALTWVMRESTSTGSEDATSEPTVVSACFPAPLP
ncbi:MAG: hypothetical protein AB1689_14560 [Thermodesulfobacteriota bacterium]